MIDVPTPGASDRIAAIRSALSDDAEAAAAFAEPVRIAVEAALGRLDTISGSAPHAEAIALLSHVRDRVAGLDPARLEPRRGLAGLFDSRGKRLKDFRAVYISTAGAAASGASDLVDRGGAIARRSDELEGLWTELRAGLTDLDDHISAGRAWLSDHPVPASSTLPPEAAAAFEDAPETPAESGEASADEAVPERSDAPSFESDPTPLNAAEADLSEPAEVVPADDAAARDEVTLPEAEEATEPPSAEDPLPDPVSSDAAALPAAVVALPHHLNRRLETLAALRARAVAALPRIRALQNADHAVPAALASLRDRIEAWSADWRDALGLAGKRPKKVRPDALRLVESREALIGHLSTAERAVASAQGRLTELTPRPAAPPAETRAAA